MNIKSLILGSAAVLVAGGAAQAADLPVAEPVDYVRVCDAYGAGYFFIPGTDTCLKISGYVRTEAQFHDTDSRADTKFNFWARGQVNFDAKEETELGTLSSRVRLEGDSDNGTTGGEDGDMDIAKAWLSLGGFYMGLITDGGTVDYNAGDIYGGDFDKGDRTRAQVGYNLALGNGVTATLALLNDSVMGARGVVAGPSTYAGQAMPAISARLMVQQGWGELAVGGAVQQLRYLDASVDEDYGYIVSAGGQFNLDMLSVGSLFAFNGFYTEGALGWSDATGGTFYGSRVGDVSIKNGKYELNEAYGVSAGLRYALADNMWASVNGGYAEIDDKGAGNYDYDLARASFEVEYRPVANLAVKAGVQYQDVDFNNRAIDDLDTFEGTIRLQRNF